MASLKTGLSLSTRNISPLRSLNIDFSEDEGSGLSSMLTDIYSVDSRSDIDYGRKAKALVSASRSRHEREKSAEEQEQQEVVETRAPSMDFSLTDVATDIGIKGLVTGVVTAGALKAYGLPFDVVKEVVPGVVMAGLPNSVIGSVAKEIDLSTQAGLLGKFAEVGKKTAGIASAGIPGLGAITEVLGAALGDTIGDVLGMREAEDFRDMVEDNSKKDIPGIATSLAEFIDVAQTDELAAIGLEIEGLGFIGRHTEEEVAAMAKAQEKGKKEEESSFGRLGDLAANALNSVVDALGFGEAEAVGGIEHDMESGKGMGDVESGGYAGSAEEAGYESAGGWAYWLVHQKQHRVF